MKKLTQITAFRLSTLKNIISATLQKKLLVVGSALIISTAFSFRSQLKHKYSEQQIESFVREVYGDQSDVLVYKSNSNRLQMINDFFSRIDIYATSDPEMKNVKGVKMLSGVSLNNKYNQNLKRDFTIEPSGFNPLKYKLQMFPKQQIIYRIDPSNYLLVIQPVNFGR